LLCACPFLILLMELFSITPGAESGEFRKMIFGMKAKIPGKLVFLST